MKRNRGWELLYKSERYGMWFAFFATGALIFSTMFVYSEVLVNILPDWFHEPFMRDKRGNDVDLISIIALLVVIPAYISVQKIRDKKVEGKNKSGKTIDGDGYTIAALSLSALYLFIYLIWYVIELYG
ncbi:hypothetical protein HON52_01850 [Candidatus Uhrbacteria bacterium]|jgi:hypothetical protein|nr:hypothetical protein [Candidatus Uhrbacteria bacterium]